MTVQEPDNSDEIFNRLTQDLDLDPVNVAMTTVSSLTDFELVQNFNEVKRKLYERDELLHPLTETGKDLQSQYYGLLIEGRKRGVI